MSVGIADKAAAVAVDETRGEDKIRVVGADRDRRDSAPVGTRNSSPNIKSVTAITVII